MPLLLLLFYQLECEFFGLRAFSAIWFDDTQTHGNESDLIILPQNLKVHKQVVAACDFHIYWMFVTNAWHTQTHETINFELRIWKEKWINSVFFAKKEIVPILKLINEIDNIHSMLNCVNPIPLGRHATPKLFWFTSQRLWCNRQHQLLPTSSIKQYILYGRKGAHQRDSMEYAFSLGSVCRVNASSALRIRTDYFFFPNPHWQNVEHKIHPHKTRCWR